MRFQHSGGRCQAGKSCKGRDFRPLVTAAASCCCFWHVPWHHGCCCSRVCAWDMAVSVAAADNREVASPAVAQCPEVAHQGAVHGIHCSSINSTYNTTWRM